MGGLKKEGETVREGKRAVNGGEAKLQSYNMASCMYMALGLINHVHDIAHVLYIIDPSLFEETEGGGGTLRTMPASVRMVLRAWVVPHCRSLHCRRRW